MTQDQAADEWFWGRGQDRQGPVSKAELDAMAADGRLAATDLVWTHGWTDWTPAAQVPGLLPAGSHPPVQAPLRKASKAGQGALRLESLAAVILLSIVTCTIYGQVVFYRCMSAYVSGAGGAGSSFRTLFFLYLLTWWGSMIGIGVISSQAGMEAAEAINQGIAPPEAPTETPLFMIVLGFAAIVIGALALRQGLAARSAFAANQNGRVLLTAPGVLLGAWVAGYALNMPASFVPVLAAPLGLLATGLLLFQTVKFFSDHNKMVMAGY